jgi:hypothetical protein
MPGRHHPTDALGFAVFRVCYAGVLLLELRQLFFFQDLLFPGGFLSAELAMALLVGWGMAVCFLLAGWLTRPAALLNYSISVVVVWGMPAFTYPLDYLLISVNFLLLFLPLSATFSLDADWRQRKTGRAAPTLISGSWPYLVAIVPLGLVYLDAVFYQLASPLWTQGLGFWQAATLPQHAQADLTGILNQQGLVKAIGYGILLFESLFLVLIWLRPLRPFLVGGGLLLHAGMGLAYPMPHLSLALMTLYIPLLPNSCWQGLRRAWSWFMGRTRIRFGRPGARGKTPPAPVPAVKGRAWLAALLLYCGLSQLLALTQTPLSQTGARRLGLDQGLAQLQGWCQPVFFFNRKFLGLVPQDLFPAPQGQHQRLMSLRYVPPQGPMVALPLLNEQGQALGYCRGRLWTWWVKRLGAPGADTQQVAAGICQVAAFWLGQYHIPGSQARFQVVVKEVALPRTWQVNHLRKQMRRPWEVAGTLQGLDRDCRLQGPGKED